MIKMDSIELDGGIAQMIHCGRKTQFRIVVDPQPKVTEECVYHMIRNGDIIARTLPYGKAGTQYFIKEPWCQVLAYKSANIKQPDDDEFYPAKQMPKWASRTKIEIINTHIERLQDISDDDIIAEGAIHTAGDVYSYGWTCLPYGEFDYVHRCSGDAFLEAWHLNNGGANHPINSWTKNPWVWVVKFKVI